MIRQVIQIDEDKCDGCGICVDACHEGAIGMVDGKAKLLRDDYCDGLGDCLPACPTNAISFIKREAAEYDETAVQKNMKRKQQEQAKPVGFTCPGTAMKAMNRPETASAAVQEVGTLETHLNQWPVQIKLVPVNAPYFDNANLLIAADCTAFAYGNFHKAFMKNRITLIGCPKLDTGDYAEKFTAILANNNIKSVTVVRMQVPCCGGIEKALKTALMNSGKLIPWQVVTISTDGRILED